MLLPRHDATRSTASVVRKAPARHAGRRRHVGRRRQLGGGGDAGRRGLRRGRASRCSSTTTARRWRARAPAAPGATSTTRGGWPRRWAFRTTCSTTRDRFRDARGRRVRRRLSRRRDAGALHPLQRAGEVPRPAGDGAGSRGRLHGDRALRPARSTGRRGRSCTGPPTRRATRAISCSRPPASSSATCASRSAGWRRRPRRGRWRRATGCRWRTSPTARTSASCRTAPMPR